ncbi:MAG: NCS2 family permease [Candidatus Omnitrophica bacterium]|nr:NCS2 family permease [Candidatus Omnitrophota bacterium]
MTVSIKKFFRIEESGSTVSREILGGITIYMTCAYILFVQPAVLSAAGMDFGAVMVATAVSSCFATVLMGFLTNYPVALAPAMGHNFFFVYAVCIGMGLSWQVALGANFISGLIFLTLCFFPFVRFFVDMVPSSIKNAIAVGIGLLIAVVGLQWGGIVVSQEGTMIGLGDLSEPYVILTILGFITTSVLIVFGIKGALLIGIIISSLIGIAMGLVRCQGIVSIPPSILPTLFKMQPIRALSENFIMIIFVFFFLDVFDTVGTLIGVSKQAGFMKGEHLPRARAALFSDALGTVCGTVFGTSTVTSYIESSAGIVAGARTGLAAVTAGICFLLSIFFYPLIKMVGGGVESGGYIFHPVTAPALILVGSFMLKNVRLIEWDDPTEAIPAFLTIIVMPMTFSITEGISFGFISYFLLKIFSGRIKDLNPLIAIFAILFTLRYLFI